MRLRKDIPDELLRGAGVYSLDPGIGILASQAAALLNRSKTRMDSDRRDSKPPPYYKDGSKVLYPLGGILALRAQIQGKSPEQAAREAADERRGWPSFAEFAAGTGVEAWPIAKVNDYPVDFLSTLDMDLEDDDLTDIEDLTRDEFAQQRIAFYREHPSGWGVAPTKKGQEWAGALMQQTSQKEGWEKGYQQCLSTLFDTPKEGRKLEFAEDYQGVRKALDAKPDSHYMSRFTVMFYLAMSPEVFKKAMQRAPHPFGDHQAGATKGEVDAWFSRIVAAKHAEEMPHVRPMRVSRDLETGRPYLVDVTGVILADGVVSNIQPEDVAYAKSLGAGLRILPLNIALAQPWRDPVERKAWADFRQKVLQDTIDSARENLDQAKQQDLDAVYSPKQPPPEGGRQSI